MAKYQIREPEKPKRESESLPVEYNGLDPFKGMNVHPMELVAESDNSATYSIHMDNRGMEPISDMIADRNFVKLRMETPGDEYYKLLNNGDDYQKQFMQGSYEASTINMLVSVVNTETFQVLQYCWNMICQYVNMTTQPVSPDKCIHVTNHGPYPNISHFVRLGFDKALDGVGIDRVRFFFNECLLVDHLSCVYNTIIERVSDYVYNGYMVNYTNDSDPSEIMQTCQEGINAAFETYRKLITCVICSIPYRIEAIMYGKDITGKLPQKQ